MRAIEIAMKDGTNFYHPDNLTFGENLAWNSESEEVKCSIPVKLWYNEWKFYNYKKPNINGETGHFTQVVWKSSRRIGCGQAVSYGKVGGTYTVCNYDPPGNVLKEEKLNVLPINKKFAKKPNKNNKIDNKIIR